MVHAAERRGRYWNGSMQLMVRLRNSIAALTLLLLLAAAACESPRVSPAFAAQTLPSWKECLNQTAEWYGGPDAAKIARTVLEAQHPTGGWAKNTDWTKPLSASQMAALKGANEATIDNGATHREMVFLARVGSATKDGALREQSQVAFLRGLDYLLKAQYDNGGWPQFYPLRKGYYTHITFNDDAMIGVLRVLRDIGKGKPEYAFVDAGRREKCTRALDKGITCILKCQIRVDGKPTAWCAQHDETTFAPAPARIYEKASFSGSESVEVMRFLMETENPSPEIKAAVNGAAAWLEKAKLTGIRVERKNDPSQPKGWDRVVVPDPNAPPVWARFYELSTMRPIFCGRDGIVKYSLAEIEHERRTGYAWYTERGASILATEYPAWKKRGDVGGK
jgi:PelA/Pel-15E family pectate lyase